MFRTFGELALSVKIFCILIIEVIDDDSLALHKCFRPFVLTAFAVSEKSFFGIALVCLDNGPLISIGSNGKEVGEMFVVGDEIFNRKHIFQFLGLRLYYCNIRAVLNEKLNKMHKAHKEQRGNEAG